MEITEYANLVTTLNDKMAQFTALANKGETGRGCKTAAKNARKLSLELGKLLKEYRKVSTEIHKTTT
jgi:hypothetical protein